MVQWLAKRREDRIRRRGDARALRAEFELEPASGMARLRTLLRDVGELERARMSSHAAAREESRTGAAQRVTSRRA